MLLFLQVELSVSEEITESLLVSCFVVFVVVIKWPQLLILVVLLKLINFLFVSISHVDFNIHIKPFSYFFLLILVRLIESKNEMLFKNTIKMKNISLTDIYI